MCSWGLADGDGGGSLGIPGLLCAPVLSMGETGGGPGKGD